jgi:hypothetical protein
VTLDCKLSEAPWVKEYTHILPCQEGAEVEIYLIPFSGDMRAGEVLAGLDKRSFRPATLPELLSLDAQKPNLYQAYSIVAPGSVREESHGDLLVPALGEINGRKWITSTWLTYRANTDRWRCAAVSK